MVWRAASAMPKSNRPVNENSLANEGSARRGPFDASQFENADQIVPA
jgi:hypothetical protein